MFKQEKWIFVKNCSRHFRPQFHCLNVETQTVLDMIRSIDPLIYIKNRRKGTYKKEQRKMIYP